MDSGRHSIHCSDSISVNMVDGDNGSYSTRTGIQTPTAVCGSADDICIKCSDSGAQLCTEDCVVVCADDCPEKICSDTSCDLLSLPDLNWENWACFDPNCAQSDGMLLDCCSTSHDDLFPQELDFCWNTYCDGTEASTSLHPNFVASTPSLGETVTPQNTTHQSTTAQLQRAFSPSNTSKTHAPLSVFQSTAQCGFGSEYSSLLPGTHQCKWTNCNQVFSSVHELSHHVHSTHIPLPSMIPSSLPTSDVLPSPCVPWGHPNANFPYPVSAQRHPVNQNHSSTHTEHHHHLATQQNPDFGLAGTHHHPYQLLSYPPPAPSLSHTSEVPTTPSMSSVDGDPEALEPKHPPELSSLPSLYDQSYVCQWKGCSQSFATSAMLTEHLRSAHIGSGKNTYECFWKGCDRHGERALGSKQKILRHLQTHTGHRPFRCDTCDQSFSEAATLQQHMRRHTNEKPFVCDEPGCGKAFATAGALTIHKRTHNGHKPFKCTYCEKCFTESSNLSKHIRTHTGDRPYACPEEGCSKRFARPDQLTRHGAVHRKALQSRHPGKDHDKEEEIDVIAKVLKEASLLAKASQTA